MFNEVAEPYEKCEHIYNFFITLKNHKKTLHKYCKTLFNCVEHTKFVLKTLKKEATLLV